MLASGKGAAQMHPRIQLLQARDELGRSMISSANAIIDAACKRYFDEERHSYFRITVTDHFGGRGHDFDCMDESANAHGGMLVIATSMPDTREWTHTVGARGMMERCRPGITLCEAFAPRVSPAPGPGAAWAPSALGSPWKP